MQGGFNQPQRQSQIGILVMFFHTLQQYARALWPVLLIWAFKFDQVNKLWLVVGTLVAIVLIAVVAYLQYRNFNFYIDRDREEFVINEGIFNKTNTVIQLRKIQQVNITQSLLQRLINVYALDVDTAGSNKKEGKIKAISHNLALALKGRLLENNTVDDVIEEDEAAAVVSEEKPFMTISFPSLLKVGITSNYIRSLGLILAFFATIYENVNSYANYAEYDRNQLDSYFERDLAAKSILFLIVLLLVAILVINIIRVVVRYYNYTITRQSGSLLLSFGLLNTKSTIVKPEKVQITSVSRNYFQKKMNILELKIKQATSGEKEERKSAIEIPGCSEREKDAILMLLFNSVPKRGEMLTPNFRKLAFSVFLIIIVPLSIFSLVGYNEPEVLEVAYLVPLYVIFVGLVLYFSFRNYRLFINEDFIIRQSGAWDITNEIIEPGKIQAITTSQLFWHKRLDIGTLIIHTAGGNVEFQLGNYTKIRQYVNLWLYKLETSDSNWM
ncbi:MAG TPA: PH domain-containing protein [Flavobacterium sp.]|jgi:putative membrane protein